ncbi:MAG: DNRLRE domain-containing protein [Phycisphaerae bacterium]
MMHRSFCRTATLAFGLYAVAGLAVGALGLSCVGGNQTPLPIQGPLVSGNAEPILVIVSPDEDISVDQNGQFTIAWNDSDPDSSARIGFDLVDVLNSSRVIPLVDGLAENDLDENLQQTPEVFVVRISSAVSTGKYFIRGTIRDDVNAPVQTFATIRGSDAAVELTVTEEGAQPASQPPTVVVLTPAFNLSVTQEDELVIQVQPTAAVPDPTLPYDADSDATLFLLLDVDDDPTNDNPFNPNPNEIIVFQQQRIDQGDFDAITFTEKVDLSEIPLRSDGKPYFVRATIDDGGNEAFHAYASGTIQVGQSVSGTVDLRQVGRTLLGVTFTGFNPGSNLGWRMITARDFDADGVDDMLLVARFGNPRNLGSIGEAYLLYGLNQQKFGGRISVNSTSTSIPGVIFEGTPPRFAEGGFGVLVNNARTEGITDVAVVSDLNADGRPELLFGLPHVDGSFQGRDDDPGDDPPDPTGDDTLQVEVVLRQGFNRTTIGDEDPVTSSSFTGFEDSYVDSANPAENFGGVGFINWEDQGPNDRRWGVIRIRNLLSEIPDEAADIDGLNAQLSFRVFNGGGDAQVHELLTQFDETTVTFNTFGQDGPNEGDPNDPNQTDFDYDQESFGNLGGGTPGQDSDVDISALVQKLIDGQLTSVNNEVLLILVPDDGATDDTQVRSSEFNQDQEARPTLTLTYNRRLRGSSLGCYPDPFVNNFADDDDNLPAGADVDPDFGFEAGGFVALVDSDNRDNNGVVNPDRLEATSVALELSGQQGSRLLQGPITQLASSPDEPGRIGGCRFQAGWYDFIDHLNLNQGPMEGLFGMHVDSMPDIDNDQFDEIIISAPTNERDVRDLEQGGFFPFSTQLASRAFTGSVIVLPGTDYDTTADAPNNGSWRDKNETEDGNATIPVLYNDLGGTCNVQDPEVRSGPFVPFGSFEIFAEDIDDFLGQARYAGDFNLDGVSDIACGAPLNDSAFGEDTGAAYIVYGRVPVGDFDLNLADDPRQRPPMLRIRGVKPGDKIGQQQERLIDVNGDRISDVVITSSTVDFGGLIRTECAEDFDGDGDVDSADISDTIFEACLGQEVFSDDSCKSFDYDNDRSITEDDRTVLECIQAGGSDCCPVDNGFVGVIFGGTTIDGDRSINQVGTSDLPGTVFFGASIGDRAGASVSSAGDFNQDGFGDLLIAAPGESRVDASGETRMGVVYLIFGGPHLTNQSFNLSLAGTDELPAIVFLSPYAAGRPNEAPPDHVGFLGDINNDGFDDIAIGNTVADFIDENLPQDPGGPGTDPSTGRRPDTGDVYVIYGNNFGSNR